MASRHPSKPSAWARGTLARSIRLASAAQIIRRLAAVRERMAIVTGATGQDGYFLVRRLLEEGWTVHAPVRDVAAAERLFGYHDGLRAVRRDLVDPGPLAALVGDVRPEEMYNLAGESSVAGSFANPRANWEANAHVIVHLVEAIRNDSPETRFYQASSGEMFGWVPGGEIIHDERSPLNPQSPYAAAKAAAHLLCRSYRESYGVRIACGILFNHESHRRGQRFLTRKVVDHVDGLRRGEIDAPLRVGKPESESRLGVRSRLRGGDDDDPSGKRRFAVSPTFPTSIGTTSSARESFIRCGSSSIGRFASPDFHLDWHLEGDDPLKWHATFDDGRCAVVVDPEFVRPADPEAIGADPSRVRRDLGWEPRVGLDVFLSDMLRMDAAAPAS